MAKDPREMPDEAELLRRLRAMDSEEAAEVAQPPGFEHEQVESDKDKPTLVVEEVKAEKIEVASGDSGGGGDAALTEDFMAEVVSKLAEISEKISEVFYLDT